VAITAADSSEMMVITQALNDVLNQYKVELGDAAETSAYGHLESGAMVSGFGGARPVLH